MNDRAQAAVDPFPTVGLLTVLVIALFSVPPVMKMAFLDQGYVSPVEYWYASGMALVLLCFIGLLCLAFLHREEVVG